MADRTLAQLNIVKEELPSIKQESPSEENEKPSTMRVKDNLMSFQSRSENTLSTFTTSSPIVRKKTDTLSKYLKILLNNQTSNFDTVCEVLSLTSGLTIGENTGVN